ncbi:MAG: type VI secretion system protein TssA, partial [Betaproteobacteria bacterium]|nr:type VI secretion system protein TssA [Betaproteobacteria bacterium]
MTFSSALSKHYLQLVTRPIGEASFAGDDVRYSSEFELLEHELSKATAVHATAVIDWQKVRSGCELLLETQSKDLRIAAWLAWSLYQRESFSGLHAGLEAIHRLCAEHWHTLHPRKPRTRGAAITWLVPRLEQVLTDEVPVGEQLALFRALADSLHGLEACLSNALGEDAPLLLPLCRQLDGMIRRATQDKPQPGAVGAAIAQVKQVATQVLSGSTPIDSDKDAQKTLRALQEQARPLAAWWLKQKATDLKPLRLSRTLLWLGIEALPERNAEQITALRGLPADKLASFKERFDQGAFAELAVDLETSIARAPFWLDGQRLVWECLQALDAPLAMREVEIQLALFHTLFNALGVALFWFWQARLAHLLERLLPERREPAVLITELAQPVAPPQQTHARYLSERALDSADSAASAVAQELQHLTRLSLEVICHAIYLPIDLLQHPERLDDALLAGRPSDQSLDAEQLYQ